MVAGITGILAMSSREERILTGQGKIKDAESGLSVEIGEPSVSPVALRFVMDWGER